MLTLHTVLAVYGCITEEEHYVYLQIALQGLHVQLSHGREQQHETKPWQSHVSDKSLNKLFNWSGEADNLLKAPDPKWLKSVGCICLYKPLYMKLPLRGQK